MCGVDHAVTRSSYLASCGDHAVTAWSYLAACGDLIEEAIEHYHSVKSSKNERVPFRDCLVRFRRLGRHDATDEVKTMFTRATGRVLFRNGTRVSGKISSVNTALY